jgi:hypothetical protein
MTGGFKKQLTIPLAFTNFTHIPSVDAHKKSFTAFPRPEQRILHKTDT